MRNIPAYVEFDWSVDKSGISDEELGCSTEEFVIFVDMFGCFIEGYENKIQIDFFTHVILK